MFIIPKIGNPRIDIFVSQLDKFSHKYSNHKDNEVKVISRCSGYPNISPYWLCGNHYHNVKLSVKYRSNNTAYILVDQDFFDFDSPYPDKSLKEFISELKDKGKSHGNMKVIVRFSGRLVFYRKPIKRYNGKGTPYIII